MYSLPYFKEHNEAVIMQFIREHPFAFLAGCHDGVPIATQIPMFIDEQDGKLLLSGHIMKNTDHHKAFLQNENVLAVFTGPHTYVSASWYSDKKQASTWNYMSVHARGRLRFKDEQALLSILKRTTDHFENNVSSGSNFDDLPKDYIERLAKAIIAFEIEVDSLENVFKLSQNRDRESYDNIIRKLDEQDASGKYIADQMQNRRSDLFKGKLGSKSGEP